jgi:hypothetical protein
MTEHTWLTGTQPLPMLEYLRGRASDRKLRLFAVAYWHRRACFWNDDLCLPLVEEITRYADGQANGRHLWAARAALEGIVTSLPQIAADHAAHDLARIARAATEAKPCDAAEAVIRQAPWTSVRPPAARSGPGWIAGFRNVMESASQMASGLALRGPEHGVQADLLRHIFGNPFQAPPPAPRESLTITRLAEAVYQGEDAAFALRDALAEAAFLELADHFREGYHPKGCWALDLVLGKQ